jgi:hypothetical protein
MEGGPVGYGDLNWVRFHIIGLLTPMWSWLETNRYRLLTHGNRKWQIVSDEPRRRLWLHHLNTPQLQRVSPRNLVQLSPDVAGVSSSSSALGRISANPGFIPPKGGTTTIQQSHRSIECHG